MVGLELGVLLVLLLKTIPDSQAQLSTGYTFVVVLPEHVAYYYPRHSTFILYFTSAQSNTVVSLTTEGYGNHTWNMGAGDNEQYTLNSNLELKSEWDSHKVVQISSNKLITVELVSVTQDINRSVLILSNKHLGTNYIIPSFKNFSSTKHPLHISQAAVSERGKLRVIVVNTQQVNEVTLEGLDRKCNLDAHRTCQVFLNEEMDLRAVRAQHPVAVLISHTCARTDSCACEPLYTVLPPETKNPLTFLIPSTISGLHNNNSGILLYNSEYTSIVTYDPNSPILRFTGSAIIYKPNLLLPLIPVESFASCYTLRGYSNTKNFAVVVVLKDQTDGVRLGRNRQRDLNWQPINGTDYVSAVIDLNEGKNIVWHVSSTFGAYHMGNAKDWFGNPAPALSATPDERGCVIMPEKFEIGPEPKSWQESVAYCKSKHLDLTCFPYEVTKRLIYKRITAEKNDSLTRVWIGVRFSLWSGEWYCVNRRQLGVMDWSEGEPSVIYDRQCVAVKVTEGFGWTTEHCCTRVHPVCYRGPGLLPL